MSPIVGHPIYSREDIREQYCITRKELCVFEDGAYQESRLFGCLSTSHLPDGHSPCQRNASYVLSCLHKKKSTSNDLQRHRSVPSDPRTTASGVATNGSGVGGKIEDDDDSDGGFKRRRQTTRTCVAAVDQYHHLHQALGHTHSHQGQYVQHPRYSWTTTSVTPHSMPGSRMCSQDGLDGGGLGPVGSVVCVGNYYAAAPSATGPKLPGTLGVGGSGGSGQATIVGYTVDGYAAQYYYQPPSHQSITPLPPSSGSQPSHQHQQNQLHQQQYQRPTGVCPGTSMGQTGYYITGSGASGVVSGLPPPVPPHQQLPPTEHFRQPGGYQLPPSVVQSRPSHLRFDNGSVCRVSLLEKVCISIAIDGRATKNSYIDH